MADDIRRVFSWKRSIGDALAILLGVAYVAYRGYLLSCSQQPIERDADFYAIGLPIVIIATGFVVKVMVLLAGHENSTALIVLILFVAVAAGVSFVDSGKYLKGPAHAGPAFYSQ